MSPTDICDLKGAFAQRRRRPEQIKRINSGLFAATLWKTADTMDLYSNQVLLLKNVVLTCEGGTS